MYVRTYVCCIHILVYYILLTDLTNVDGNIVIAALRTLRIVYQYDSTPDSILFEVITILVTCITNIFVTYHDSSYPQYECTYIYRHTFSNC